MGSFHKHKVKIIPILTFKEVSIVLVPRKFYYGVNIANLSEYKMM